ncbi:MAG: 5-oxoprolinase subunit PxpB [Chitinophagaceae bacterium]|nr:5-oxoprolinase subunit PxpB [Chitinophagaceae bacterium]
MLQAATYQIYPIGDQAITLDYGGFMSDRVNQQIMQLFHALKEWQIDGILDIIPAYHSISIVYELKKIKKQIGNQSAYNYLEKQLRHAAANLLEQRVETGREMVIPVCYDLSLAPDLAELAAMHKMSIDEVIDVHCAVKYRVYMIGFLPGFAYMGKVADSIATERKSTPRLKVPAGSVGIAGNQTGIYPFESPGGWQLIAQTPVSLFDAEKEPPTYLQPGDIVSFKPIGLEEFHDLKNNKI